MEQSLHLSESHPVPAPAPLRQGMTLVLALAAAALVLLIGTQYRGLADDAPLFAESTLAQLAAWMADQAEADAPPALLAQLAKTWTLTSPQDALTTLYAGVKTLIFAVCVLAAVGAGLGAVGGLLGIRGARGGLLVGLIGLDSLLFLIPVLEGDTTVSLILLGILLLVAAVTLAPGRISRTASFFVIISLLLVAWEGAKMLAERLNYAIVTPQPAFTTTAYASLDEALTALETGAVEAIVADENDLEDLMPVYPRDTTGPVEATFRHPNLRYLSRLQLQEYVAFFPLTPDMPGRLSIAVRSEDAARVSKPSDLLGQPIGAVTGDFALDKYLAEPRALVLLDLKILNDLNLPHLQSIAQAFLQPARRNGEFLLVRILSEAALYTLREAVFGFVFGALLGLLLGTAFAHSPLMERALLPYVVASQTIPILAIAPMVVIWLGASFASVAVIATYITFFPVTINTLRGLKSPHPTALELMASYAATRWMTLWKLRFPAAVPYIFAALKVSATASVVGAIIGELPSGMGDGLGRAILDFSSDYSLTSTPKLWAAIVTAAFIGVIFFVLVGVVERVALRRYVRGV